MLHTKFHGNQRVFTIYGHGGHLGHVTNIIPINFHFYIPKSLHTKFGYKLPSGFRKACFNFYT